MLAMAGGLARDRLVTLDEELTRRGKLEAVGGAAYLIELSRSVPSAANARAYIRIVDEEGHAAQADRRFARRSPPACYAEQEETQAILEQPKRRFTTSRCAAAARNCSRFSRCCCRRLKRSSSW